MALDPTLQELAFRRSIKKFFVDSLVTISSIFISFESLYKIPVDSAGVELDSWINFHFDGLPVTGNIARGKVAAYLFSRRDADGVKLATIRDALMDTVTDLTANDGIKRVPLYDTAWNTIGGMLVVTGTESSESLGVDETHYKFINLYFSYATK